MARVSRSSKARAMRVARQQRQGDHRPLACESCGADLHAADLVVTGVSLLCSECDPSEMGWDDLGS